MNILCNLTLLFALYKAIKNTFIKVPCFYYIGAYDIVINLTTENITRTIELNMNIDYLWFKKEDFTSNPLLTYVNSTTIEIQGQQFEAELYYGDISFNETNVSISNFYFFQTKQSPVGTYHSLPLAYKFKDTRYSVIHTLFNNKIIENIGFGFVTIDAFNEKGFLYIGGIPQEEKINYPYHQSCKVNSSYPTWGCRLQKVNFNNLTFNNIEYASLDMSKRRFLVSHNFFTFFINYILQLTSNITNCPFSDNLGINLFQCPCKELKIELSMELVFDGFSYNITKDFIMYTYLNKCLLRIDENKENPNEWMLGSYFITRFLTYFDYDKGIISFYSKKPFTIYSNNKKYILFLLYVITIIEIIQIIFILYCKIKH